MKEASLKRPHIVWFKLEIIILWIPEKDQKVPEVKGEEAMNRCSTEDF